MHIKQLAVKFNPSYNTSPVMVNPVWNDAGYPLLASTTPTAARSELNFTSDCDNFPLTQLIKILNKSLCNSGNIT